MLWSIYLLQVLSSIVMNNFSGEKVCVCVLVAQSCPTLCNPTDSLSVAKKYTMLF